MSDVQTTEVISSLEFDSYSGNKWKVEVRETIHDTTIVLVEEEEEHVLMIFTRDMWGTWISMNVPGSPTVAQEDETRSFMAALIDSLRIVRSRTELGTLQPTEIHTEIQDNYVI